MTETGTGGLVLRDPTPEDEAVWRRLWADYVAFYEADVPDAVTACTWTRMLDDESGLFGRLAEFDGTVVGFTVSVLHPGSWTSTPVCYLEDLFVDPSARGRGIGRALIDDLVDLARQGAWSRLYWHTKASNAQARKLYDQYTQADDFVRYRLFLD